MQGLSRIFDELGSTGDHLNHPTLKALALFLAMSLSGDVLDDLSGERSIIFERDPILDVMSYASFYLPQMKKQSGGATFDFSKLIKDKDLALLNDYLIALTNRVDSEPLNLLSLVLETFSGDYEKQASLLKNWFQVSLPTRVLLLEIDELLLAERLKFKEEGGQKKELHEAVPKLLEFQSSYERLAIALNIPYKRVQVHNDHQALEQEVLSHFKDSSM